MSRVLRRPMFRGGSPNRGITTGLGRQGFKNGGGDFQKVQSQLELIDRLAGPRDSNLGDFMINWGLNMVGNPPSGGIFQTAAKQAQEPFRQYQAMEAQEGGSRRNLIASLVGQLSEEDLDKVQQMIPYYMKTFNVNEDEAVKMIIEKDYYSKEGRVDPRVAKQKDIKSYEQSWMKQPLPPKPGDLRALAEFTYNYSNRKYGDLMGDIMPNNYIKSTYKGQAKTEDGEVVSYALNEDGQSAFEAYEGKIFFDPATGNLYRKQGVQLIKVFDYADIK
jgi:hypothetical protein